MSDLKSAQDANFIAVLQLFAVSATRSPAVCPWPQVCFFNLPSAKVILYFKTGGIIMRYLALPFALVFCGALGACSSQDKMARSSNVSMPDAIRTAEASIPGSRATQSHLEKEGEHTVYEVKLTDNMRNDRTVWVDASSGRIIKKTEP